MMLFEFGFDLWGVDVVLDCEGDWIFCVEGWLDFYGIWEYDVVIKVVVDVDIELMFIEGVLLFEWVVVILGWLVNYVKVLWEVVIGLWDVIWFV